MSEKEDVAAFYEKHYSDWTVHEMPLVVYVPTKDEDREFALGLIREILDKAAFDIHVAESDRTATLARELAEARKECDETAEARDRWRRRWSAQRAQFREMLFEGMSLAEWHETNCLAAQAASDMRDQRDEARERLERVAAIHYPSTDHRDGYKPYCVGCWEAGGEDGAPLWPCPTMQALRAPADAPQGGSEGLGGGSVGDHRAAEREEALRAIMPERYTAEDF